MVEIFQKTRENNKHFPLLNIVRNKNKHVNHIITTPVTRNGTDTRHGDPYMPHLFQPQSYSSPCLSQPRRSVNNKNHLVTHHKRQSVSLESQHIHHHHHHHHYFNSPPSSPTLDQFLLLPPLSPNTITKPSWRSIKKSPKWHPASSISSEEEDNDNEPLGFYLSKPFSLLSNSSEDGDDDLIPIARLSTSTIPHLSAAEKYKAKVKAKLQMEDSISII